MAKAIMIQGTMSNAGKSLLVAGLCRILKQDGYRVAPFKSQNMALNSYITKEGLEMGRAQVMQAEAAGIEPSVYMNPILLKPTGDVGSQVIVNGEVLGNMSAKDYFAFKKSLFPKILEAYRKLEEEADIIVIEGAGSPAEINLKSDDIVNMGMAKLVGAPVLLVGDIDRGGVYAQLLGTVEWLTEEEKSYVKGMIINKFRGDESLLGSGNAMLEERVGIPVLGVVPYVRLDIDDEDSLSERLEDESMHGEGVDIAVVRLPRISNFTDFNRLAAIPGVHVRYVSHAEKLGTPDLVILPGTKNTMEDLKWLRAGGMEAAMRKAHEAGCPIFGICGGYQMLGRSIRDPQETEAGGEMRGLGLLPMETTFAPEKVRTRVRGEILQMSGTLEALSGMTLDGYEIHMGRTECELPPMNRLMPEETIDPVGAVGAQSVDREETSMHGAIANAQSTGRCKDDGCCLDDVYGTYVHGFFDADGVARKMAEILAGRKGIVLEEVADLTYEEYKETQYDLLAQTLREHLPMEQIYEIIDQGMVTC